MSRKTFTLTIFISFVFLLLVATNIIPQLRGPAPYPSSWQWPYQADFFTLKLIFPLLILSCIVLLLFFSEKKKQPPITYLGMLVLLLYFFQLAILYFSRGGIGILLQRVIDPGMSGYFTTAIKIQSTATFLSEYHIHMHTYYTHPRAHPAGFILFFGIINSLSALIVPFFYSVLKNIQPHHLLVSTIWIQLSSSQQLGAVLAGLVIPFLAVLLVVPVYAVVFIYADHKTALRTAALSGLIPALFLFTPLPDILFPVVCLTSFFFLLYGIKRNKVWSFALSGLTISIAMFAGLNSLPFLFILFLYLVFTYKLIHLKELLYFMGGLITLPFILIAIFQYHYLEVVLRAAVEGKAPRDYWVWLPFNLLDFIIYTGIPLMTLFLFSLQAKTKENLALVTPLRRALFFTLLLLLLSGMTRGETGRLWIALMPLIVLAISGQVTSLSTKQFLSIMTLQAFQILVMQGYWVSLW